MAKRKPPDQEPDEEKDRIDQTEGYERDPEEAAESAGQSSDDEGLSNDAEADEESVKQLADTDQAYEAEIVEGVEEAGDNPEKPVPRRA